MYLKTDKTSFYHVNTHVACISDFDRVSGIKEKKSPSLEFLRWIYWYFTAYYEVFLLQEVRLHVKNKGCPKLMVPYLERVLGS